MRQKLLTMICAALLCMGAGQVWAAVTVNGKLPGAFSVSATEVVYFSQGNLRASTMNNGSSWTWTFATRQWDYIGTDPANTAINGNGSVSINGYVDLFYWSDRTFVHYGILISQLWVLRDFKDWGQNAILNGGNTKNAWRTLTQEEWDYLFNTRSTASGIRYVKATVNSIAGVILLPDNWNTSYYALSNTNTATAAFTSNTISSTNWTNLLEPRGAVFLPAAGMRYVTTVYDAGSIGDYMSASSYQPEDNPEDNPENLSSRSYKLYFSSDEVQTEYIEYRYHGGSVRLVSETAPPYAALTKSPTAKSLTYTGSAQALVNAGTASDGTMNYSLDNSSWSTSIPTATNVGNYTVYYKVVGDASHADYLPSSNKVAVTINKATPTVTAPTAKSLTYNGSAQALVNAGSTTGGTLQYKLGNGSWGTSVPTATAAGSYTVYYKVVGNANYNDVAQKSVSVTINKATLTCKADNKSINYNANPPTYTATYSGWKGSDNTSVLSGTLSFACSYAKGSNAGSYTITPSGVTASNYNITFQTGTLTVNKINPTVTAPTAKSLTYNGSAQALVNAGSTTGGTLQYSLTSGSGYGNAIPTQTAADTYTVYYKVDGNDNYNAVAEASLSVTISKAALTCTADNKSANYGDNPPTYTATYSGWKGSDNTSVLSGTLSFACSYAKGSNAGSYTITPSGVTASNYNITFQTGTLTVNKINPTVTAPTAKSLTYNGSAQALVNAGSTTGGTLQYSLTSGSGYGNAIPTQTAADTYTVYYKVDGNDNYNAVAEASVSVTINKADVILTAPTPIEGLVYTGAAQTLINAGTVTGGELLYKLDAGAYSTSLPQATEADIHTVYYKVDGDANHNNVAETSFTVTIGDPTSLVLTANRDPQHPDDYYSTFYHCAIQYALPEGSEAYAATLSGDALNLTRIAEAGDVLPADNAVILKASGSSIILTPSDESPVTFEVINNLRGVDVPTAAPSNCYVLSGHNSDYSVQGVGFYLFTGTIPAHKAYATIDGNAGAPTRLRFVFNNEQTATGIQNASAVLSKPTKVIENGTLYIIRDGIRYNAQGQIVK